MEIVELSQGQDALFDQYYDIYLESLTYGNPSAVPLRKPEVAGLAWTPSVNNTNELWLACVDGVPVATVWLEWHHITNENAAYFLVYVLPQWRRRGIASQLLAEVERRVRAAGRTLIRTDEGWLDQTPLAEVPAYQFLTKRGFELTLGDRQRRLALPVDRAHLEGLLAQAAEAHPDYRLVSWSDPAPEEFLAQYAALEAQVAVEAPHGDDPMEASNPDPSRIREEEAIRAAQDRQGWVSAAIAPNGEMAAFSEIVTSDHEPEGRCFQWGTLVARAHRGRRLGLAVKAANLLALDSARPDLTHVVTFNADVNAHMIAVNEQLGFEVVGAGGSFLKELT